MRALEASEVVAYLRYLPRLWDEAPGSRGALAEALFERVEVLGLRRMWIEPTPSAITGASSRHLRAHLLVMVGARGIAPRPSTFRSRCGSPSPPSPATGCKAHDETVILPQPRHDREVSVVAAVLAAGSEKAAAQRLGVSHSTVKHHLANARSKVGVTTTAQLVWILGPRLPEPEGSGDAGRGAEP